MLADATCENAPAPFSDHILAGITPDGFQVGQRVRLKNAIAHPEFRNGAAHVRTPAIH